MFFTNIVSRIFNLKIKNLGVSGSSNGDKEVVLSIEEIERYGCFMNDYDGKVTYEKYKATLISFILTIINFVSLGASVGKFIIGNRYR
ncbi:SGNH/GDSL hydrolase family protein [Ornithinibacillus gellani]|uniref:hypothetical protein n=1 Tax=Ornithinibacillus gellani TaxID=2293253 RepID=UPI000F4A8687